LRRTTTPLARTIDLSTFFAFFDPPTRIENACRRASNIMLNAPSLPPRENELIAREIQEIRDALEAFKAAVEAGELTGISTRRNAGTRRYVSALVLLAPF
jgi:hypothetical protein